MNKGELTQKMAFKVRNSNAEAAHCLDAFLCRVGDELKSGGEVNIPGFGN